MSQAWLETNSGYPEETTRRLVMNPADGDARRLVAEDLDLFWMIDFRNPNGVTPLGMAQLELAYGWASNAAADSAPVHTGDGFAVRLVGTFCYTSDRAIASAAVAQDRKERMRRRVEALPDSFSEDWQAAKAALADHARPFQKADYPALDTGELRQLLSGAREHIKYMWERHFYWMYPLLALQNSFYDLCDQLGISRSETVELLGGEASTITATDMALEDLAIAVDRDGLRAAIQAAIQSDTPLALLGQSPDATNWLSAFKAFLDRFGWRADVVGDPSSPSWREAPQTPLRHILSMTPGDADERKQAKLLAARVARNRCEAEIRTRLSTPDREVFDSALTDMRKANFVWWQEDHNALIDMCAMLPLRHVALEIGRRLRLKDPEDIVFLFSAELFDYLDGSLPTPDTLHLIEERKRYFADWQNRRTELPRHFGQIPEAVDDAVYTEIEGLTQSYLDALNGTGDTQKLEGVTASGGVVEGRAHVVLDAKMLPEIEDGEILVCEGSTPSWTPVFSRIAACIADQGGTLSHTAIVAREQELPCVVGLGTATQFIKTGDWLHVDADAATVRIVENG